VTIQVWICRVYLGPTRSTQDEWENQDCLTGRFGLNANRDWRRPVPQLYERLLVVDVESMAEPAANDLEITWLT
jgi:hypothetical protein